jgi:spore germination cell wall hydrolase CwlJ-like protein
VTRYNVLISKLLEDAGNIPPPPPAIIQQAPIRNVDVVAAALIGEAGGEGNTGMHAVMNVITNRAKSSPDFVRGVIEAVLKPKQFSYFNKYNSGGESMISIINKAKQHPSWNKALEIALAGLSKKLPDITSGATHYHVSSGPGKVIPKWSSPQVGGTNPQAVITNTIGHHTFLKNIR